MVDNKKGETIMKKIEDLSKITFQLGKDLKHKFVIKCAELGVKQRHVIINLLSKWIKNDKNTFNS